MLPKFLKRKICSKKKKKSTENFIPSFIPPPSIYYDLICSLGYPNHIIISKKNVNKQLQRHKTVDFVLTFFLKKNPFYYYLLTEHK